MIRSHGVSLPCNLAAARIASLCPHCGKESKLSMVTTPASAERLQVDKIQRIVIGYTCDFCHGAIGVEWSISDWIQPTVMRVDAPREVAPSRPPFDLQHVPTAIAKEVHEALDCFSVQAWNGFGAMCRRSLQCMAKNMGADGDSNVQAQVRRAMDILGLPENHPTRQTIREIMLAGHDGAHPHLPNVDGERAEVLLRLMQDVVHELYVRPGRLKASSQLRAAAIERTKAAPK